MATPVLSGISPNPVSAGQAVTVTGGFIAGPSLTSITPSLVTAGQPVTVSGTTSSAATVALGTVCSASLSISPAFDRIPVPLAAACSVALGISADMAPRSPAPTLLSVSPNPVTAGATVTVTGGGTTLLSSVNAALSFSASLTMTQALASVVAPVLSVTSGLAHTVTLPATLIASDMQSGTASPSGDSLVLDAGEWAEFGVDSNGGADFSVILNITGSGPALLDVQLDGVTVQSLNF